MKKWRAVGVGVACVLLLGNLGVAAAEYWTVVESSQSFIINGQPVDTASLNINGRNYLQVAEFAELLDIDIRFDESNDTVALDTTKSFTGVQSMQSTVITDIEKITIQISPSLNPTCVVAQITPDGKLICQEFENGYDYFSDPAQTPVTTKEKELTESDYAELIDLFSENAFMTLPEEINAENIYDGQDIQIEVQANGTTHKVGGYMPDLANKNFSNIYKDLSALIKIEQ
jgi:hypothetical protein